MTEATLLPFDLPAVHRKKLTVDFDGGNQSSDGGLLLLRQAERKLGVCRRLAEVMPDHRDQSRVRHEMFELVAARAFAISCGYKDGNDLNRLRHDPLIEDCCRALSRERQPIGITIDDLALGERAAQGRSCSADRGAYRSILLLREAEEVGDPRH